MITSSSTTTDIRSSIGRPPSAKRSPRFGRGLALLLGALVLATPYTAAADNRGRKNGHGRSAWVHSTGYSVYDGRGYDSRELRALRDDLGRLVRRARDFRGALDNRFRYGSVSRDTERAVQRFVRQAEEALDDVDSRRASTSEVRREISSLLRYADDVSHAIRNDRDTSSRLRNEWADIRDQARDIARAADRYAADDRYYSNGSGWHHGNGGYYSHYGTYPKYPSYPSYPNGHPHQPHHPSVSSPWTPSTSPWVTPPGNRGPDFDEWRRRRGWK